MAAPEEIRDHVNKAEDMVEMLLDWRRALTTSTPNPRETTAPTRAISTLMVVPRAEVKELVGLIEALSRRAPAPSRSGQGPFGDLRAHVDKAAEIARELMPAARAGDGAKAGGSDVITVDRTALERLEIEIDAIERVLPRTLAAR